MSLLLDKSRTFGEVTLLMLVKVTQIIWENIMAKNHMIFNNEDGISDCNLLLSILKGMLEMTSLGHFLVFRV